MYFNTPAPFPPPPLRNPLLKGAEEGTLNVGDKNDDGWADDFFDPPLAARLLPPPAFGAVAPFPPFPPGDPKTYAPWFFFAALLPVLPPPPPEWKDIWRLWSGTKVDFVTVGGAPLAPLLVLLDRVLVFVVAWHAYFHGGGGGGGTYMTWGRK